MSVWFRPKCCDLRYLDVFKAVCHFVSPRDKFKLEVKQVSNEVIGIISQLQSDMEKELAAITKVKRARCTAGSTASCTSESNAYFALLEF